MIYHKPVLADEVVQSLDPRPGRNYIDCTVGGGGHAEKILAATEPDGKLLGLDWDGEAVNRAGERLARYGRRAMLVQSSYTKIKEVVYDKKFNSFHGILLDLGLSSDQLQNSRRGFSFQVNEPLDMRFAPGENELTAAQILNEWPEGEIEVILRENANERNARKIARAIVEQRKTKKFASTLDLTQLVMNVVPPRFGRARINPATKTFQALRMAVNDEIGNIQKFLSAVMEIMPSGCRLSVITFHSIEDRVVKDFFKLNSRDCLCPPEIPVCRCGHKAQLKLITHKPITPSEKEVQENFRARSAKLRVVEKT
ncbi:16S rRNA (cytosine(1402)-N(4))-methyltransferase [Candidatus Falkowbacteria bacterium RIFOXYC2_FULL_48_21]|uniref:Ribosomal RNA small subunit methyltransferase H n=1 Tax=Candidatus Falkowbacteria bacterium RIFOXYC2_FULL_48_21 TaxID=1798005 RepID=A0A1F5TFE9_9BACT|nr:MAG: 16S rRNA (cytosine(1402)-N(4))-methyltransferase [Candidatus Falkowbacteria bacterium RIFOXYC2_FULL_48_21]